MLISSMGRYAVLTMLDLAEHRGAFVPVRQIAERQELSQKYLERILRALSAQALVEGTHGKGGGYRLTRDPSDYSIGEILRAADGSLSCLGANAQPAPHEAASGLCGVWSQLDEKIEDFLNSVPLSSLTSLNAADEYVI